LADIDAHAVDRVVLDIRTNSGGNSSVIAPLTAGLKARPTLRSRIFVLIGPETFSSGQLAAWEFRRQLGATLVGEPSGEALNSYGEVKVFTLPHSQLRVQYSTKYFRLGKDDLLDPQIRVAATLEDVLAGRDPVLDAALAASLPSRR
jgi:C-terminal processing protease CtpA/Prc